MAHEYSYKVTEKDHIINEIKHDLADTKGQLKKAIVDVEWLRLDRQELHKQIEQLHDINKQYETILKGEKIKKQIMSDELNT